MRREIVVISLILPLLLVVGQSTAPVSASPGVIRVPQDHKKIQWAVGNASAGDIIQVAAGIYYENNITIDKSLTLMGESSRTTIIDANETSMVFRVAANYVTISGFTIRNALLFYGIGVYTSSSSNISDNIIVNNWVGVYLYWGNGNIIRNNIMINNQYNMRLYSSNANIIRGNAIVSSLFAGIQLYSNSSRNHIINNGFSANDWYGIWLDYSASNVIHHNNFVNNKLSQVYGNSLKANSWNNNASEGNYWSDYEGNDTNTDGIGDTNLPHFGLDNYPLMVPWGDLNDDNAISEADLNLAATFFGTYTTQTDYNPRIDLNGDNIIDIFDLVIISVNFQKNIIDT